MEEAGSDPSPCNSNSAVKELASEKSAMPLLTKDVISEDGSCCCQRNNMNTAVDSSSFDGIPVINLQRLSSPSLSNEDKEAEMEKLRKALGSWGLFQVVGHGIPTTLLDEIRDAAKEFFHLPIEQRQKYSASNTSLYDLDGYTKGTSAWDDHQISSSNHDSKSTVLNSTASSNPSFEIRSWTDGIFLSIEPRERRNINRWPGHPNHFRDAIAEYCEKSRLVGEVILKLMAKLLGLDENYFLKQFGEQGHGSMKFNYYPPCPRPDLVYGLTPHSDGGGITILLQDKQVEGLQVLKNGKWINVPTIQHALVINVADCMEILSNGQFISPVHRVIANAENERLSVAKFVSPEFDKEIEPAPGSFDNDTRPKLFRKVKVKDYMEHYFSSYYDGKQTSWAKI